MNNDYSNRSTICCRYLTSRRIVIRVFNSNLLQILVKYLLIIYYLERKNSSTECSTDGSDCVCVKQRKQMKNRLARQDCASLPMEICRRQVSVSDLPPDVTEDDLELLFESPSFCPDGGDVERVDVDENARTAVVTLHDHQGTCVCLFVKCRTVEY